MAFKMIDDWKKAWRYASVQISALGLVLMSVVELANSSLISLPPYLLQQIPHSQSVALVLFGLGLIGRIIKLKGAVTDADQHS